MKMAMVSAYDRATATFNRPFVVATTEEAIRSFTDEVNRTDSAMGAHPEDFDLYLVAFWSPDNADLTDENRELPQIICRAQDVKRGPAPDPDLRLAVEQLEKALDEIQNAHRQELANLTQLYENNLKQAQQKPNGRWPWSRS